ncbi:MAG: 3-dehydroquinate dehydratase [Ignavibacteriales bacterium]|nr:3-dehydroquinate dehydratase [Ignavibacteriales bacterium]
MKILVLNGPNLNLLKKRDPGQYGKMSLEEIEQKLVASFPEFLFTFKQSNSEAEIIEAIQNASASFSGLIINPAAYSHYSFAIRDALELCSIPKIEVHLSNIFAREEFRNVSVTAAVCLGVISGLKENSYLAAAYTLKCMLERK